MEPRLYSDRLTVCVYTYMDSSADCRRHHRYVLCGWRLQGCSLLDGVHIDATWQIRLNRPCAAAMRPYVKILWPLLISALWAVCLHVVIMQSVYFEKKINYIRRETCNNVPCRLRYWNGYATENDRTARYRIRLSSNSGGSMADYRLKHSLIANVASDSPVQTSHCQAPVHSNCKCADYSDQ